MPSKNLPANDTPADDLPRLRSLTDSGVGEFYQQVKVQPPPKERSPLAERLWPFKPKSIQLDND